MITHTILRKELARVAGIVLVTGVLTSCYSPNQQKLEDDIRTLVYPGMAVSAAIAHLSSRGFACTGDHPVTCSRVRQRLLPSSCVERVSLEPSDPRSAVRVVDVHPIVCAGL